MKFFASFACFLYLISVSATALDAIVATQKLENGSTLVSSGGVFELGFFTNGDSQNQFLGIWYKKISIEKKTIVWVANRDHPLNVSSGGALKLTKFGTLIITDASDKTIWSSNSSDTNVVPIAQLLDSGNLVVRNATGINESLIWESFDHPGDTLLPGMKYGIDFATGRNRYLTSWKRPDDPGTGEYYNKMDPNGLPQFFLYKGSAVTFRSGAWNGLRFSGMPNLKPNSIYKYEFVSTEDEVYYTYSLLNDSLVSRFMLSTLGILQRYTWIDRTQGWVLYLTGQMDNCDTYAQCGPHGTCDINNSPACECLKGFVPKFPHDWGSADWSNGCVRKAPLSCGDGEGFLKYLSVKWPDTKRSWYNKTTNLEECERVCLTNCSCTAYSSLDVRDGGTGCLLWFGDLIDIRNYPENGQDIYVRMAASEIEASSTKGNRRLRVILIPALCVVGLAALLLGLSLIFCALRRKKKENDQVGVTGTTQFNSEREYASEGENDDLDLPLFEFATIADATENFSPDNKLGQGGFGPVYKGVLRNGQEIAVKRLSRNSRQGLDEFKNEVLCIAKLQHRNLVKLLGCCIQVEERLLIYEYMSNKSLDFVIFDKKQRALLDWSKRFHIINGIARGLLYLHQDSRLRIIHRDLKASNILLDESMNPKISDFGMARSFGGDETSANTTRVVGTYGYMSPEYAIDGLFSVKSDVFSFGVLVLEIVSGKRNRGFSHPDHKMNLLGHTWMLHNEGRPLELIEASTKDSYNVTQTSRAIHVGLLCVQQNPDDRPSMSTVVLMLTSDIALPQPNEPGFYTERYLSDADSSSSYHVIGSTNNGLTVTLLHPR